MNKRILGLLFCIMLCLVLFGQLGFADTTPPLRPDTFTASLPVYDSTKDENNITLNWSASDGADFYLLEITTDSNWAGQSISEQRILTGLTYTDIRQNSASSPTTGTIFKYKLYACTYIKDKDGNPTADYVKSTTFDSATVLTDPSVVATSVSTSEIQLSWDDVQFNGQSIGYTIDKFKRGVNVGQDQIRVSEIGTSVKRVGGKLVYSIQNLDKSTEYTFHLVPGLDSNSIRMNPYVTIQGATKIDALLQTYNESIVKLMWDEYQGSMPATDLYYKVIEITTDANGNKTYRTIATPEVPYYYIEVTPGVSHSYLVEVRIKADDSKVAESEEVNLQDMVVPVAPVTPNINLTITNNSTTIDWDTYKTINGARDTNVKFDVWLLTDPKAIDSVRAFYTSSNNGIVDYRIGKDLDIGGIIPNPNFSLVKVGGLDKYRYVITGLSFNSTYYVGVVAKKTYLLQDPTDSSQIINQTYNSDPAMATVKTTSGNLEQPVAVVKPPGLNVAVDAQGKTLVTKSTITITWPLGQTVGGVYTPLYQSDVYFKVGYEEYFQAFDKSKTNDPANLSYNIKATGVTITLGAQNGTATITGLKGNTPYVFWVKAYRDIPSSPPVTRVSEASDPIIVVTLPDYTIPNAKPPVPAISVLDNQFPDKVTIQFDSIANMKYTIAWAAEDNVAKRLGSKDYTPLSSVTPDSFMVDGLDPEKTYYFWIMAANGTINSEWSDSAIGRTTPVPPPDPVEGFGVKKVLQNGELVPDIGEHYVTLQWDKVDKIDYIIEVSKNSDFSNSDKIDAGNVSEYKLATFHSAELPSNLRVWIRIFAKDTNTNKISQGSMYLTVKTKFNYDEYDSSKDKETPLSTEIPKGVVDGTAGMWSVDFTGDTADVLMEKIKNQNNPDYSIDMSKTSVSGITKRQILIPYRVIDELSSTNQDLIIKTNKAEYVLLPGSINQDTVSGLKSNNNEDIIMQFDIQSLTPGLSDVDSTHQPLSEINLIELAAKTSQDQKKVIGFSKPIKVELGFTDNNINGINSLYNAIPGTSQWIKINSEKTNIGGTDYMVALYDKSGKFIVRKQTPDLGQLGFSQYNNEINSLLSTSLMKSVNANDIKPARAITLGEAVKMLLDASEVEYEDNYMDIGQKSGVLNLLDNTDESRNITREEAISMLMRTYEIRTGQHLPKAQISKVYSDAGNIDYSYSSYIGNALSMQILKPNGNYIGPLENITRGEFMAEIQRLLQIL